MKSLIPDSIEPYVGWKFLEMDETGLYSPYQRMPWPVKERAEATCQVPRPQKWVAKEGTKPPPTPSVTASVGMSFTISAVFWGETATTKPDIELPWGYYWKLEPVGDKHLPGQERCQCGIYAVARPTQCVSYKERERVLCQVALWGNTTLGDYGARAQYGYPTKIVAHKRDKHVARDQASLYGVPVEIVRNWDILKG